MFFDNSRLFYDEERSLYFCEAKTDLEKSMVIEFFSTQLMHKENYNSYRLAYSRQRMFMNRLIFYNYIFPKYSTDNSCSLISLSKETL